VNAARNILRLGLQALAEGAHARKQRLRSPRLLGSHLANLVLPLFSGLRSL
jgi:hypothetical protein